MVSTLNERIVLGKTPAFITSLNLDRKFQECIDLFKEKKELLASGIPKAKYDELKAHSEKLEDERRQDAEQIKELKKDRRRKDEEIAVLKKKLEEEKATTVNIKKLEEMLQQEKNRNKKLQNNWENEKSKTNSLHKELDEITDDAEKLKIIAIALTEKISSTKKRTE